jgi:hypothetical protein
LRDGYRSAEALRHPKSDLFSLKHCATQNRIFPAEALRYPKSDLFR